MADQIQIVPAGGNGPVPDPYDPSKDPKRKAKSGDPGWKYGYWHDMDRRDRIRCKFCGIDVHGGIARFKRHLLHVYYCKVHLQSPAIKKEEHGRGQEGFSKASGRKALSWQTRLQIAKDGANALEYLHFFCNPQLCRRDIKLSNILLVENFVAKVVFDTIRKFDAKELHISR